jgi:DNA processing protein
MRGDERLYALALLRLPGIGSRRIARLRERFGSLAASWHAPFPELRRMADLGEKTLAVIEAGRRSPDSLAAARRELEGLARRGLTLLLSADPAYPPLLREIPDPPEALFVRGRLDLSGPMVALVGTRAATAYGLRTARRLAAELAANGVTVVSGLAIGIDAAAHAGAVAAGRTVAVLGAGLDHVGPASNRRLAEQIVEHGGALISEYLPATPPAAGQFPARNRIVSGMSHATVVIEAPLRSGALITADLALEQGREVMAVPGPIDQVQSAGALALLSQGAKLVTEVSDILSELPGGETLVREGGDAGRSAAIPPGLPADEARVLRALGPVPRHVNRIAGETGLPVSVVTGLLLVLELKAFVVQLPGNSYIRHS